MRYWQWELRNAVGWVPRCTQYSLLHPQSALFDDQQPSFYISIPNRTPMIYTPTPISWLCGATPSTSWVTDCFLLVLTFIASLGKRSASSRDSSSGRPELLISARKVGSVLSCELRMRSKPSGSFFDQYDRVWFSSVWWGVGKLRSVLPRSLK